MARDKFTDLRCRIRTGFNRGTDTSDIAFDNGRNQPATDTDFLDDFNVQTI